MKLRRSLSITPELQIVHNSAGRPNDFARTALFWFPRKRLAHRPVTNTCSEHSMFFSKPSGRTARFALNEYSSGSRKDEPL